jgi:hypothetical protein
VAQSQKGGQAGTPLAVNPVTMPRQERPGQIEDRKRPMKHVVNLLSLSIAASGLLVADLQAAVSFFG